jgi:hypothetical protein
VDIDLADIPLLVYTKFLWRLIALHGSSLPPIKRHPCGVISRFLRATLSWSLLARPAWTQRIQNRTATHLSSTLLTLRHFHQIQHHTSARRRCSGSTHSRSVLRSRQTFSHQTTIVGLMDLRDRRHDLQHRLLSGHSACRRSL